MKMNRYFLLIPICLLLLNCQKTVAPPEPFGPLPSKRQLEWQELQFYAFVHFNMNTFTNMEWGYGDEDPDRFNPTQLDTRQWARICKQAGMKGIIITAKHHDGFCLWPSEYTEHSVKSSSWKDGEGDVIRELAEACKEYDLKLGIYLSPWDRNHPDYGTEAYVDYFKNQLRELLTNYGEVFEVWFDGANGGDGYYGGANEVRKIDATTYYKWPEVIEIVRELQPNAVIFGDGGPDVRWVGNEEGWANETNWSLLRKDEVYPGWPKYVQLRSGHEDGTHWIPAECNVSIRPGWYYHPYEDHKVKTLPQLMDIYYHSLGRNGNLLINFPVDNRGLIHEKDSAQIIRLAEQIKLDFGKNLVKNSNITSSNTRGNSDIYKVENTIDKDLSSYWATDNSVQEGSIEIKFEEPTLINTFLIQEYIPLGQRVTGIRGIGTKLNGEESILFEGTTIGNQRIFRFTDIELRGLRIEISAKAPITISNIEVYARPKLLDTPIITRNKAGELSMTASDPQASVYYTVNLPFSKDKAIKYVPGTELEYPATIYAVSGDPDGINFSDPVSVDLDLSKQKWIVSEVTSGDLEAAQAIVDDDPNTWWISEPGDQQSFVIDFGEELMVKGFTYMPMQDRWIAGVATEYKVLLSNNGTNWSEIKSGEFSNILNNPILQQVTFSQLETARYLKFQGVRTMDTTGRLSVAEIGVLTK